MMRDEREVRNEIAAAGEMGMRPKPSTNSGQRLPSPFMGLEGEVLIFVLAPPSFPRKRESRRFNQVLHLNQVQITARGSPLPLWACRGMF